MSKNKITQFFKQTGPSVVAKASPTIAGSPGLGGGKRKLTEDATVEKIEKKVKVDTPQVGDGETTSQAKQGPELNLEPGWKSKLQDEAKKSYFLSLHEFLNKEAASKQVILPPRQQVFTAFDLCPFDSTKVVILGQDPYHGLNQAHGLAFSVSDGITPPPSLRNIFKEIQTDVKITIPKSNGNLSAWAKQGVLLLNTVLTVRQGLPNSHKDKGWEKFTDQVIRVLNEEKKGLVFLLWGKPAQSKMALLNKKKHHIITSSHPSPLGATKTNEPFIGSKCFSRTNKFLVEEGHTPIDWSL